MQQITLYNIPNQEFELQFADLTYRIRLKTVQDNFTLADIYINDELIKGSVRCCPNMPLIPYEYLQQGGGNFIFHCFDGNYPIYTLFNKSQVLIYFSAEEIQGIKNNV